jgi:hypothetical protein
MVGCTPIGQEKQAAARLSNIWMTIESYNIYQDWSFPYLVSGFINKPSFLDSSPEPGYIAKTIAELGSKIYRKMEIGISNANDGSYFTVNETTPLDKLPRYIQGTVLLSYLIILCRIFGYAWSLHLCR